MNLAVMRLKSNFHSPDVVEGVFLYVDQCALHFAPRFVSEAGAYFWFWNCVMRNGKQNVSADDRKIWY